MVLRDFYLFLLHNCIGNPRLVNQQFILSLHIRVMITVVPRFSYCGAILMVAERVNGTNEPLAHEVKHNSRWEGVYVRKKSRGNGVV